MQNSTIRRLLVLRPGLATLGVGGGLRGGPGADAMKSLTPTTGGVWTPTPESIAGTNVAWLMRHAGVEFL